MFTGSNVTERGAPEAQDVTLDFHSQRHGLTSLSRSESI